MGRQWSSLLHREILLNRNRVEIYFVAIHGIDVTEIPMSILQQLCQIRGLYLKP